MSIIIIILSLAVPIYISYRFGKVGVDALFNFNLYPLVFSYFYLLLPGLIPVDDPLSMLLGLSEYSAELVNWISAWTVFVFLGAYLMTTDRRLNANHAIQISAPTLFFARGLQIASSLLMLFLFIKNGASIYATSSDRTAGYEVYAVLLEDYKLFLLFNFTALSCMICYIWNRKTINFSPFLFYCLLDLFTGGRAFLFYSIIIIYLLVLTFNREKFKRFTLYLVFGMLFVLFSAFFRRHDFESNISSLFTLFGEFYGTRLMAQYAIDYFNGGSDLLSYFTLVGTKFVPQFLIAPVFSPNELMDYAVFLNTSTNISYGLAGSIVAEAVYYGGAGYAFVAPVLISSVYWLMNRIFLISKLPGFLFFLLLSAASFNIFRSSFFIIWASLIYLFVFYFGIILYSSASCIVFELEVLKTQSDNRHSRRNR